MYYIPRGPQSRAESEAGALKFMYCLFNIICVSSCVICLWLVYVFVVVEAGASISWPAMYCASQSARICLGRMSRDRYRYRYRHRHRYRYRYRLRFRN